MDIPRYALMIALALVGWMTLVEWNNFRNEHSQPAAAVVRAPESTSPAADMAEPPSAPASDLPAVHATVTAAANVEKQPIADTISVITDTLMLQISLVGGDIVSVSLPAFQAELGRRDLPFRLLEQSTTRNYTAQSGLVGPDGTDTAEGRPTFSSAKPTWTMADGENKIGRAHV